MQEKIQVLNKPAEDFLLHKALRGVRKNSFLCVYVKAERFPLHVRAC